MLVAAAAASGFARRQAIVFILAIGRDGLAAALIYRVDGFARKSLNTAKICGCCFVAAFFIEEVFEQYVVAAFDLLIDAFCACIAWQIAEFAFTLHEFCACSLCDGTGIDFLLVVVIGAADE